jgi:signal transduction histidine kinase
LTSPLTPGLGKPRFYKTLLFKLSALFLGFLGLCLGGYFLWLESRVLSPYADNAEKDWYENRSEHELESLAARLATGSGDTAAVRRLLSDYQPGVAKYGVELMVFRPDGLALAGAPGDSLTAAVPRLDAALLAKMASQDWDFGTYPNKADVDAYENRVFAVNAIGDRASPAGWLVGSYPPIEIGTHDVEAGAGLLQTQRLVVKVMGGMLVLAAIVALILMGWTSRRIRRLALAMEAFRTGNLERRVGEGGSDEIDDLGRHFNHMASHISTMVDSLRQKEQFQRQLIANVSHDLRTPMASLRGHVESLDLRFEQLDAAQRSRALQTINGNLDHLDRLVERMLVLSRLDAGQTVVQAEEFSVVELADSVMRRCEHLALPGGIALDLRAETGLPLVKADPLQIAQVLQNLVENGIKFNRPQGSVTVRLAQEPGGGRVRVSVSDTGQGIGAADLPHVFERFYTGDASRTRRDDAPASLQHSSGLGLAIASKLVAAHGDELTVSSRAGAGATFTFHLAAAAATGKAARAAAG